MTKNTSEINMLLHCIFLFMGCFYAANQLLVNNITEAFQATDSQMAMMIGALYAGPMLMVLFFGEFSDRVGRNRSVALAILMVCLGALIVFTSQRISHIIIGFVIYGAGIGGTESVLFAITSDENGEKSGQHLLVNQALFSIGAMISPVIISNAMRTDKYKIVYFIILVLAFITLLFFIRDGLEKKPVTQVKEKHKVSLLRLIGNPLMLFYMMSIIIITGSESALTYWTRVYFKTIGAAGLGAIALSVYWFASILGRFTCSRIANTRKIILPCLISATIGVVILLLMPNPYLKLFGLLIVGAAFAPIYPTLGFKASVFFPLNIGAAFSLITFSSNLGGVISQPIISEVSGNDSITKVYAVIAILCGILSVMSFTVQKLEQRRNVKAH